MSGNEIHEDQCYDDVKIGRIEFKWRIKNFSKRTRTLTSKLFPASAPEKLGKWRLRLILKYGTGINIRLEQETSTVRSAIVIFSISDYKDPVARGQVTGHTKFECSALLADRSFVFHKNSCVLSYDELTIVCKMEIRVPPVNSSPTKCEPPPCRLLEDLGSLLASGALSDVTIAVAGSELKAHKIILAARSPVFAAMFSNQMLEKETGVVEITDMDKDVVQAMLEFIYTGKVILQMSWAHDLLAAATKYQLDRPKFMCEEALGKALTLDNVLENLAHADLHSAARLKEQCISFVTEHRTQILITPSWKTFKLSHQSLVVDILEKSCIQEQNFSVCSKEAIEEDSSDDDM